VQLRHPVGFKGKKERRWWTRRVNLPFLVLNMFLKIWNWLAKQEAFLKQVKWVERAPWRFSALTVALNSISNCLAVVPLC